MINLFHVGTMHLFTVVYISVKYMPQIKSSLSSSDMSIQRIASQNIDLIAVVHAID